MTLTTGFLVAAGILLIAVITRYLTKPNEYPAIDLADIDRDQLFADGERLLQDSESWSTELSDRSVTLASSLDPFPGGRLESERTIYIKAEVIVEERDGKLEVRVEGQDLPDLQVSKTCRDLLKESRGNRQMSGFLRKRIARTRCSTRRGEVSRPTTAGSTGSR